MKMDGRGSSACWSVLCGRGAKPGDGRSGSHRRGHTWAFVSEEVDVRLCQASGQRLRLRLDEWKSDVGWLIYAVGNAKGVDAALRWLKAGPFKERPLKAFAKGIKIRTLSELIMPTAVDDGAA